MLQKDAGSSTRKPPDKERAGGFPVRAVRLTHQGQADPLAASSRINERSRQSVRTGGALSDKAKLKLNAFRTFC